MELTYTVILRKEADGGYTVLVPALPGCFTQGETVLEALAMAKEAIECYVESLVQHGEPVPKEGRVISFEREELTEGFLFRVTAGISRETTHERRQDDETDVHCGAFS